ncbi:DUF7284 family protein [Halorubrum kocurii]|uniref:Uncharacterized protein n=1 Tax=Halorubrum kocurii JCM 14978 TaxID=1230456 RepID=M0P0D3_9EURY|nr:hypothetical protein [Halorubrum kocurii]EMA62984.1 hypothetical protein C468_10362 [Halorubrum kocurii JCM 14978]
MTSTVLDVTVLLLCVSASVVALGAVGGDRGPAGADAAEVADLIATETVTVTYASAEAPSGTRTVHATRAELLALVAAGADSGGEKQSAGEAFESEALAAVERAIGPRTRIDARVHAETAERRTNGSEGGSGAPSPDAGIGPTRWSSNASAAPLRSEGWEFGPSGSGGGQDPIGTGVPWRVERPERGEDRPGPESSSVEPKSPDSIAVGREPPRDVDVSVAVVRHPAPDAEDAAEPVRIVIRRW